MKFVAPVYPGDVMTTHGTVTACHPEGAGQRLTVGVSCTDHIGSVVLIGAASAVVDSLQMASGWLRAT